MKTPFRFPLLAGDIATFCHPDPNHDLHEPHILDGALVAANGYIAVRADRGRWMASDFTPPTKAFTDRISPLAWGAFPPDSAEWRAIDDVRGQLFRFAPIGMWIERNHRIAPSPVWQVGGQHLIRLSHLQALSRLPRCEVHAGSQSHGTPCYFRFNGGIAIVPPDPRLAVHSFSIFAPSYHPLEGHRIARTNTRQNFSGGHLKNWPPPPPTDD